MDRSETDQEASSHAVGDPSSSITTSSESESFDTWTLVTPELTTIKCKKSGSNNLEANETYSKKHEKQEDGHREITKKDDGHTDGEMSDGISIISDSESGGRISPHPAVRRSSPSKRLSSQGSRFETLDQDSDNTDDIEQSSSIYKPLTPPHTPSCISTALVNKPITIPAVQHGNDFTDSGQGGRFPQGFNVNFAFFVAIFVGILAILGRMKTDPNLQTTDLSALYSKLNEILAKTSHIETMIQDAINGLDDRSYDQYSNMLIRIHELNEKFEANNLAMKDVLNQLTKSSDKCPNIKPPMPPNTRTFENGGSKSAEFIAKEKYNSEKHKTGNSPPPSYEKSKSPQEDAKRPEQEKAKEPQEGSVAQDKYRRPKDEREDRKYKGDDEQYKTKPKDFRDDKMNQKNGFKKHEAHRDYNEHKNGEKKQYESHEHNTAESKNENHEHGGRYKNGNGYNERKAKNNNRQYGSGDRMPNSKEQEENWMDRRKRFREDARKNVDSNEYKRHSGEDANWYLDRGTGRQKARKFEYNDKRS